MSKLIIDIPVFREQYPAMKNPIIFPDAAIGMRFEAAKCFLRPGSKLHGECYVMALYMLTAHLLWSAYLISKGQTTSGIMTGATISKVSISVQAPPAKTSWQFWLSTTPYGLELWALLSLRAAGGWAIGGMPERKAFKKVGGCFM